MNRRLSLRNVYWFYRKLDMLSVILCIQESYTFLQQELYKNVRQFWKYTTEYWSWEQVICYFEVINVNHNWYGWSVIVMYTTKLVNQRFCVEIGNVEDNKIAQPISRRLEGVFKIFWITFYLLFYMNIDLYQKNVCASKNAWCSLKGFSRIGFVHSMLFV